jgi:hypothetical protein
MHYGRSIYALQLARFEIGDDLPDAVYAAGANGVEILCGEFRKHRANAAARDDLGSGPPEKIRKLSHPVEVRLQPRQENEVVLFCLKGIEGAVPVLVIQTDIESLWVNQRSDMKAAYRLHYIARPAFNPAGTEMCADYKGAPFFCAIGKGSVQLRRLTSRA